jgi:large subunit ribosomal protein L21
MFAVVRTGGKQYRVAPGDKIVVEKVDGEAGQSVDLTDVLLAGEGSDLKSVAGLVVAAEIVAQAKADKVTVFKKRRRHNYRRKKGHRQQHTILKIVSIGGKGEAKKPASKAEAAPKAEAAKPAPAKAESAPTAEAAAPAPAKAKAPKAKDPAKPVPSKVEGAEAKPKSDKPAAKPAKAASTKDAAPAKAAAKKTPKK